MNILNDISTLSYPMKEEIKTIELTAHTSCYWGLKLTLCKQTDIDRKTNRRGKMGKQDKQKEIERQR